MKAAWELSTRLDVPIEDGSWMLEVVAAERFECVLDAPNEDVARRVVWDGYRRRSSTADRDMAEVWLDPRRSTATWSPPPGVADKGILLPPRVPQQILYAPYFEAQKTEGK